MTTLPLPLDELAELNSRFTSNAGEWLHSRAFLPFKGQLHMATMLAQPTHVLITEVPGYLCMDWDGEQVIFLHRHVQLLSEEVDDAWYISGAFSHLAGKKGRVAPDDYWVAVDPVSWGRLYVSGVATTMWQRTGYARRCNPPRRDVADAAFKRLRNAGPAVVAAARLGYFTKYLNAVPLPFGARMLAVPSRAIAGPSTNLALAVES